MIKSQQSIRVPGVAWKARNIKRVRFISLNLILIEGKARQWKNTLRNIRGKACGKDPMPANAL